MGFCFVHAADLHIDSPFKGLAAKDAEVAARFAGASRDAFVNLIDRTIEERAAFLIVAGDVFDGDWQDYTTGLFFNREVARLARAGIHTFVVRGNHDAENKFTRRLTGPDLFHMFDARKAETVDLPEIGAALHGRSFASAVQPESMVRLYPPPRPGRFNIGLLHTSLDGREGHARYAPTSVAELSGRGYDYWALGHVHAYEEVARDPWIVFPGNLQGRNVRETGAKGAVLVTVGDDLRVAALERLVLDEARWAAPTADVSGAADRDAVYALMQAALGPVVDAAAGRPLAVRLTLAGSTALHHALAADPEELAAEVQNAAHRLGDAIWIERVVLATTPEVARATPGAEGFADAAALIDEVMADKAALHAELAAALQPLLDRLPQGSRDELPTPDELLAAAHDLLLGRLGAA